MTGDLTRDQIRGHLAQKTITEKEAQVLEFRARGFSWKQIAHGLHISTAGARYLDDRARQKIAIWKEKQAA